MMLLIPAVITLCGLVSLWNIAVTALAEKLVDRLEAHRAVRRATPAAAVPTRFELAVAK